MKFEKVLITGGSRGIGRQLVKIFLNKGSEVHAVSRNFHDEFDSPQFKFHSLDLSNTNPLYDNIDKTLLISLIHFEHP